MTIILNSKREQYGFTALSGAYLPAAGYALPGLPCLRRGLAGVQPVPVGVVKPRIDHDGLVSRLQKVFRQEFLNALKLFLNLALVSPQHLAQAVHVGGLQAFPAKQTGHALKAFFQCRRAFIHALQLALVHPGESPVLFCYPVRQLENVLQYGQVATPEEMPYFRRLRRAGGGLHAHAENPGGRKRRQWGIVFFAFRR